MQFYRTDDQRFILKQISRYEMASFLKFAPNYFHYLSTAATEGKLTALAKKFGVFRIGYRNAATGAAAKMDVFVMEYLFYERTCKEKYDFKGSLRNRHASEKTPDLVALDENFLKDLWSKQFMLHAHSKVRLASQRESEHFRQVRFFLVFLYESRMVLFFALRSMRRGKKQLWYLCRISSGLKRLVKFCKGIRAKKKTTFLHSLCTLKRCSELVLSFYSHAGGAQHGNIK